MASVGCAYTVVPRARTKREYLEGLRLGRGKVRGETGGFRKLTRDVLWIGWNMLRENPWTLPLAPLAPAIPLVILGNYVCTAANGSDDVMPPPGLCRVLPLPTQPAMVLTVPDAA